MTRVKRFTKNTLGNDYVVGDIHGCFTTLKVALRNIGFNEARDRLFSVGDLVDRGYESEYALEWLEKPWFHAVRGNHEEMFLEYFAGRWDIDNYCMNGGRWAILLDAEKRDLIRKAFSELPYVIEVETDIGLVGIVHADVPNMGWSEFVKAVETTETSSPLDFVLWSRDTINRLKHCGPRDSIDGVDQVFLGHTVLPHTVGSGNMTFIDTGCVYEKYLTILCLDKSEAIQQKLVKPY